jgi:hypothetical protein
MSRQERRKTEMVRRKEIKKAHRLVQKELREKEAQGGFEEKPRSCSSNV